MLIKDLEKSMPLIENTTKVNVVLAQIYSLKMEEASLKGFLENPMRPIPASVDNLYYSDGHPFGDDGPTVEGDMGFYIRYFLRGCSLV